MKTWHCMLVVAIICTACSSSEPATRAPVLLPSPSATLIPQTPTLEPTLTPTPLPTITPTPTLGVGSTTISPKDQMVQMLVPGGTFQMGSVQAEAVPVHEVTLSSFWIDQTEVTNAQYALCVADSACPLPKRLVSQKRRSYYDNPEYANHPVIHVTWDNANAYCAWAGRRLPTEAEWEFAARGTDGRTYPWGNGEPSCALLNYAGNGMLSIGDPRAFSCIGDTNTVGSYPEGASPFGALDMAGNVWEWVADWYGKYSADPQTDPNGPASGGAHINRGVSFNYIRDKVSMYHSAFRLIADGASGSIGFRCAQSK